MPHVKDREELRAYELCRRAMHLYVNPDKELARERADGLLQKVIKISVADRDALSGQVVKHVKAAKRILREHYSPKAFDEIRSAAVILSKRQEAKGKRKT